MTKQKRSNTNRQAIVRTRTDKHGNVRTETARRNSGIDVAARTNQRINSTKVFIDLDGRTEFSYGRADVELNGRQARTLYRALAKHFGALGKLG